MCASELFAIHASVQHHTTSQQCIHHETESKLKPKFFLQKIPSKTTVHKDSETVMTLLSTTSHEVTGLRGDILTAMNCRFMDNHKCSE